MEKPIRILHVLGTLNRGGAETMIMNVYRNIDRSKIQFDFVIHTKEKCDYDDEIIKLGGNIYSFPRYLGKNHFKYKKAWDIFFNSHQEYKIVHGHMRSTAAIYLKIAKKHGLITIAHSHSTASRGNKVEQFVKNIMQFPIRYIADYLFACSDDAGKWLFGNNVIKKNNYRVIKNAIDAEKYVFNEAKRNEMRKALGIEDKFVVGHTGSFSYPKNHKFLIDFFYQVQKKNKNVILLLVGDGELRPQIEKQINSLDIKDKVILTGIVPNVNDYMQVMDVFVFPSMFEGLGIVTIEAQAAGLLCIVADTVPKEAFITNLIEKISLSEGLEVWADKVLKCTKYKKRNTFKEIRSAGFDVVEEANVFEAFYEKQLICNKNREVISL
ncbi:glycosyl transferase family 1 [Clostridium carboxidivorans P7]|uniref:Glycosyl transferase group 1 n=1 Tax=Clostridium carboxidivorans P7 TaxID=536227 RepID=C6PXY4_9CLOT|nr:glycosyltransferase family 1 protein [Clostridium carboxidivorans]AKN31954.1 glycosyl transferase family 1 [Clostridium carboxidivorans P7]EET85922.1 glycosyl transferase group 1 [Clostridium carboxidivorans P7]EFG87915.1 glycosyltransferase, group 1 family protein [Clostridium carboxidivorans P7]